MKLRSAGLALALLAITPAASADDAPSKKLDWEAHYGRFGPVNYAFLGSFAVIAGVTTLVLTPRDTGWSKAPGFDERVRDTFRVSTYDGRVIARRSSDVLLGTLSAFPYVVDAGAMVWGKHHDFDSAFQMALIDAEAMSLAFALQGTVSWAAGRARPYVRDCGTSEIPKDKNDCEVSTRFRSFFSGHSTASFVSASLICSHHLELDLFESSAADIATCVVGLGAAATTATLRMMGDMHYATDVLTGAAIGTLVGFGIPWWHRMRKPVRGKADGVAFTLVPSPNGVSVAGTFR